jgi:small subunit ribosomal protein S8
MTDPVADLLCRIRNAAKAQHKAVDVPASNLKREIVKLLNEMRFIRKYSELNIGGKKFLRIWLRYNKNDESIITGLERVSKPGLRVYVNTEDLFKLQQKVGTMLVSTSQGVLTHKQALKANIGGEILCRVW